MVGRREVVTLQFGHYANYVGAHWWNLQESSFNYDPQAEQSEVDHDVLYREGHNANRQATYTPRMLLVDLDGCLKHLPVEGELYNSSLKRPTNVENKAVEYVKKLKEDTHFKDTEIEVVEQPDAPKHDFQRDLDNAANIDEKQYNLADDVDSWVDFLYARYHPRTVNIVKTYKHTIGKQSLDTFTCGEQLWRTELEDDFCDKIRQYVEECDFVQGFQTIFDCFNGFSGLATQALEHLNDEYNCKANFVVPLFSPKNTLFESADETMGDSIRVINSALTFKHLSETASLFVPLSTQGRVWRQLRSFRNFDSLQYKADNLYHTSAILAAYLDTISLRYRLKNSPASSTISGFCNDLNNYGRKFAAAAFGLPFPMAHDMHLIDCLDKLEGNLYTQLTPNCKIGTNYVVQSVCVRGIPRTRLKLPREQAKRQLEMAAYKCDSVSEMLQLYLQCTYHASMAHVSAIKSALPTRIPFPCEIFENSINTAGFRDSVIQRPPDERVTTVPAIAAVQVSGEIGDTLESLHREAKRIKIEKLHRFKATGLEADEYEDTLESLLLFKDKYEDNWEL